MILKKDFYKKILFWIEIIFEVVKLTIKRLKEQEEKTENDDN